MLNKSLPLLLLTCFIFKAQARYCDQRTFWVKELRHSRLWHHYIYKDEDKEMNWFKRPSLIFKKNKFKIYKTYNQYEDPCTQYKQIYENLDNAESSNLRSDLFAAYLRQTWRSLEFTLTTPAKDIRPFLAPIRSLVLKQQNMSPQSLQRVIRRLEFQASIEQLQFLKKLKSALTQNQKITDKVGPIANWWPHYRKYLISVLKHNDTHKVDFKSLIRSQQKVGTLAVTSSYLGDNSNYLTSPIIGFDPSRSVQQLLPSSLQISSPTTPFSSSTTDNWLQRFQPQIATQYQKTLVKLRSLLQESKAITQYGPLKNQMSCPKDYSQLLSLLRDREKSLSRELNSKIHHYQLFVGAAELAINSLNTLSTRILKANQAITDIIHMNSATRSALTVLTQDILTTPESTKDWLTILDNKNITMSEAVVKNISNLRFLLILPDSIKIIYGEKLFRSLFVNVQILVQTLLSSPNLNHVSLSRDIKLNLKELQDQVVFEVNRIKKHHTEQARKSSQPMQDLVSWAQAARKHTQDLKTLKDKALSCQRNRSPRKKSSNRWNQPERPSPNHHAF